HRQRHHASDDRHPDPRTGVGRPYRLYALENPDGPIRHGGGGRIANLLAGEPRMLFQHRRGLRPFGRPSHILRLALMQNSDLGESLRRLGLIGATEAIRVTPLTGGVSSDISLIEA